MGRRFVEGVDGDWDDMMEARWDLLVLLWVW